ncbi:MAG: hypothetical protein ACJ779_03110 [Chloroflexota bacterium]
MPSLTAPKKIERPTIDLSDIELPKIDLPKVDVGEAVASAATAVGLMKKRRSRWPFILGLGICVAVAGWAWMNFESLRTRASGVATKVSARVNTMRSGTDDTYAFPAADPKPIESTGSYESGSNGSGSDYPEGFGGGSDMAGTSGDVSGSGLETASSRS